MKWLASTPIEKFACSTSQLYNKSPHNTPVFWGDFDLVRWLVFWLVRGLVSPWSGDQVINCSQRGALPLGYGGGAWVQAIRSQVGLSPDRSQRHTRDLHGPETLEAHARARPVCLAHQRWLAYLAKGLG